MFKIYKTRKFVALFLVLVLAVCMLSVSALAVNEEILTVAETSKAVNPMCYPAICSGTYVMWTLDVNIFALFPSWYVKAVGTNGVTYIVDAYAAVGHANVGVELVSAQICPMEI